MSSLQQDHHTIQHDMVLCNEQIDALEQDNALMTKTIETFETDIDHLKDTTLQTENAQLQKDIQAYRNKIQHDIHALKSEMKQHHENHVKSTERLHHEIKDKMHRKFTAMDSITHRTTEESSQVQSQLAKFRIHFDPTKQEEIQEKITHLYQQFGPQPSSTTFQQWIQDEKQTALKDIDALQALLLKNMEDSQAHFDSYFTQHVQTITQQLEDTAEVYVDEIQDHMDDYRHMATTESSNIKGLVDKQIATLNLRHMAESALAATPTTRHTDTTAAHLPPPSPSPMTGPPSPLPPASTPIFQNKYPINTTATPPQYHNHEDHPMLGPQGLMDAPPDPMSPPAMVQKNYKKSFLSHHKFEASLQSRDEEQMRQFYQILQASCAVYQIPLKPITAITPIDPSVIPPHLTPDQIQHYSQIISAKLQQPKLFKDPIAWDIAWSKIQHNDGYGALQALIFECIPHLRTHSTLQAYNNDKPLFDASKHTVYSYEAQLITYYNFQAKHQKGLSGH